MIKHNIKTAKDALNRARKLAESTPSDFRNLTPEQAVRRIRETREKLWKDKIAHRS